VTPRQELAKALDQKLRAHRWERRSYRVGGSELADAPAKGRTVALWVTSVKSSNRFRLAYDVEFDVWVFVGMDDPRRADDDLDEALQDVLGALASIPGVQWSEATRATLANNQAPGWLIKVTATAQTSDTPTALEG
jgi:hypothetical protein